MEGNKEYYSLKDIVLFFKLLLRYLKRKWGILLLAILIGIMIGFIYYRFFQKPKYEAVCTFILEEKQNGISGLGGLATQFGFDMGSLSGGGSICRGSIF